MSRKTKDHPFFGVHMSSGLLVRDPREESVTIAAGSPRHLALFSPRPSHRIQPLEKKPPGSLLIHEIYRSLQGESTFAGLPCVFVRLTACNLRCVYCDTPHAFTEGQVLDLEAVVNRALELGDDLVEITGGEPLLQPEVHPLMTRLADAGKTVLLETSGALDIGEVDLRVRVILDIKTPGSGEVDANVWSNLDRLKPIDEVKIVVCSRADFDWAIEIVRSPTSLWGAVRSCSAPHSARSSPPSWPRGSSMRAGGSAAVTAAQAPVGP